MKLIDNTIVDGVYIDRSKNLAKHFYTIEGEGEKLIFKKGTGNMAQGKGPLRGGVDFEKLL